eukprot:SAG31_NODE_551_length_14207_cov_7.887440_4_plen_199_part_00
MYCWSDALLNDPQKERLTRESASDLLYLTRANTTRQERRCVLCPGCVSCVSRTIDGNNTHHQPDTVLDRITMKLTKLGYNVKPGFASHTPTTHIPEQWNRGNHLLRFDLFQCPTNESCPGFNLEDSSESEMCNKDRGYGGLLCSTCDTGDAAFSNSDSVNFASRSPSMVQLMNRRRQVLPSSTANVSLALAHRTRAFS